MSKAKAFIPTEKQRQAADPSHSVWVSANAGSGKTQVLVQRVIRILLEGIEPASILCITYTKAAAAEMADRLFAQLASWTALSDVELSSIITNLGADGKSNFILTRARKLFTLALETPGGLKIQTIHAFCERLLHLFPVEAGLAPGFGLLEDRAAEELRQQSIAEVVFGSSTTPEVAEAFARISARLNMEQFGQLIESYVAGLRKTSLEISTERFTTLLKEAFGLFFKGGFAEAEAEFSKIDQSAYAKHAFALKRFPPHSNVNVSAILNEIAIAVQPAQLMSNFFFTQEMKLRKNPISAAAKKQEPETAIFIERESKRLETALLKLKSLELIEANGDAFTIAFAVNHRIVQAKQLAAKVDFEDLIRRTAQLLSTSSARDWVSFKLDPGLSHILLDESQDTGPSQWIIINRLVEEFFAGEGRERTQGERTLFVVGDDKQSIYSFQGADASEFLRARQLYLANPKFKNVPLDISYRSTETILEAVDRVHTGQAADGKTLRAHIAQRGADQGIVEIWPLQLPDDAPELDPWAKPIDVPPQSSPQRRLANTIAYQISQWLNPESPRKLAGRDRAVNAGDILILFRNRGPLFRMVMAELRAAGIPVAGADRLSLLKSIIVQDLLALLNWLLLPQDDHALACVLKSPLVPEPLSEEQLFHAAYDRKVTLFERLVGPNQVYLKELQAVSRTVPVNILLARILADRRRDIVSRLGPEALEASDAMLDMAIDFQKEGAASLFAFLQWFMATETTLKREMDKPNGEVRLMTVHGAKGLEAPIVFIANAAQGLTNTGSRPNVLELKLNSNHSLPIWYPSGVKPLLPSFEELQALSKQKEEQESNRLLYVAMTRAEDELYITGVGQKNGEAPKDSWWPRIIAALGAPQGDEPKQYGAEAVYLPKQALSAMGQKIQIPDWLSVSPQPEFDAGPIGLNAALSGQRVYDPQAAKLGRARHRLLQDLGDVAESERRALAQARAARLGLREAEAVALAESLSAKELQPFLGQGSRAEVEIRGKLADGRLVSGRLDRLAERPDGIWLLDYKTGTAPAAEHLTQMAGYVELLTQAYPGLPIQAALFLTQNRKFELLSQDELAAALQESDIASA